MDRQEFEKFYWEIYPELLRFARRQGVSDDAEDVVANAFLTLWRKDLPAVITDDEFRGLRALAYEVVRGHLLNEQRSRLRRRALGDRLASQMRSRLQETAVQPASVEELLSRLSPADREVVLLTHAGFVSGEIAQILKIPRAAAEKRQSRAKKRLRAIMESERGQTDDK